MQQNVVKTHFSFIYLFFLAYLTCSDQLTADIINKLDLPLQTLSYCSKTEINTKAPEGCAIITVSAKCEVHLLLKGLIDPPKEIVKLQKKLDFLQGTEKKLSQLMAAGDYETKVPPEVQQSNKEKLSQTATEIDRLNSAIEALKQMSIQFGEI